MPCHAVPYIHTWPPARYVLDASSVHHGFVIPVVPAVGSSKPFRGRLAGDMDRQKDREEETGARDKGVLPCPKMSAQSRLSAWRFRGNAFSVSNLTIDRQDIKIS